MYKVQQSYILMKRGLDTADAKLVQSMDKYKDLADSDMDRFCEIAEEKAEALGLHEKRQSFRLSEKELIDWAWNHIQVHPRFKTNHDALQKLFESTNPKYRRKVIDVALNFDQSL